MANILLHSLVFAPDGNSNAYIFSDIALELQKAGHNVSVITTTPHYSVLQDNINSQPFSNGMKKWYKQSSFWGIPCYHIVVDPEKGGLINRISTYLRFHWYALRLAKFKDIKADVVIAQSPPLTVGIINYMIAKIKNAKAIYIVQDLFPDGPIEQGKIKNKILIKALRIIEKKVYTKNDAIIAISDGIYGHLKERVPSTKTLGIIPNFVNCEIYHPLPKNNYIIDEYNLKSRFVVSYVGNIGNAHDLSPLLYCAKQLKDINVTFLIAGSGIRKDYFETMAKEDHLDNVIFMGYQKRENTPYINAISDICLVMLAPHVKSFSFPSKTYTLMAMGKPIIVMCSNESNVADFITNTRSGWVVDSGKNEEFTALIKELYNNRSLLDEVGANSLQAVQDRYTKEIVGNQYSNLIGDLLKNEI